MDVLDIVVYAYDVIKSTGLPVVITKVLVLLNVGLEVLKRTIGKEVNTSPNRIMLY